MNENSFCNTPLLSAYIYPFCNSLFLYELDIRCYKTNDIAARCPQTLEGIFKFMVRR